MNEFEIITKLNEIGLLVKKLKQTGTWQRCPTIDKSKKLNGAYICGLKICSWVNWAKDEKGWFWIDDTSFNKTFTPAEKAEYVKKIQEAEAWQKQFDEQDKISRIQLVNEFWTKIPTPTHTKHVHSYLTKKQVRWQHDFKIDWHGRLLILSYNIDKIITGAQYIDDQGKKLWKTGSYPRNSFYPIISNLEIKYCDIVFICEGYATGDSIYQALNDYLDSTNYCVLCAFSANNVDNVAKQVSDKFGQKKIIAIKDQDHTVQKIKTKGFIVHYKDGGDANDIHLEFGLDKLAEIIVMELGKL